MRSVIAASGVQVLALKDGVYAPANPRIIVEVVGVTDGSTSVEVGPAPGSFASSCWGDDVSTPLSETMIVETRPVDPAPPQVIVYEAGSLAATLRYTAIFEDACPMDENCASTTDQPEGVTNTPVEEAA